MSFSPEFTMDNSSAGMPPVRDSSGPLKLLETSLGELNARVAQDFLALASVLQSNSRRARDITVASHNATGSEVNQRCSQSIELLQQILTESAGVAGMVDISIEQMSAILLSVATVADPLRKLTKVRSLLNNVSVLSRIEESRIATSSDDISALSQDIDALAGVVQQHLSSMLEDSDALHRLLRSGVSELSKFGKEERDDAAELIHKTQAILGPFLARSDAAREAAREINEQYVHFHRATDKVVMSLQSEDLARQRVEHMQTALSHAANSLKSGSTIESCAGVLVLQRAQLVSTRDLLVDSIQSIHSGLQSLGPWIEELLARTAQLATQAGQDGQSFAAIVDSGLGNVAEVFERCSAAAKSVAAIVEGVLPPVSQMTKGAVALEEIETCVRIISLNAKVKTAQLGREGAAMGIIASELHAIATQSEEETKVVLDELKSIAKALGEITQGKEVSDRSLLMKADSSHSVSGELDSLTTTVRSSSQEVAVALGTVRRLADSLVLELKKGCEMAAQAASIKDDFETLLISFDTAFEQLGLTSEMVKSHINANQAEDLSNLYSMESERILHEQVFGTSPTQTSATEAESGSGSEFGDDVELF